MQAWSHLCTEPGGWGEGGQTQGKHPWPPVGKGQTLLSREGFGALGLSKLVVSKAECEHTKAAQDKPLVCGKKMGFVPLIN